MANNKIVYGDQTLIDLTSDTVTPETLAMGETAHSASGAQIVGTMSPSGGTHITPSNSPPVALTSGDSYIADANGYAISSYNNKTPSNSSPPVIVSGEIDKIGGNGYAISSYNDITPSNLSPVSLTPGEIYKIGGSGGYAIKSYKTKTITAGGIPVPVRNGEIDKIAGSNGYLIDSYATIRPTTSGEYFAYGMTDMLSSGYAYISKPTLNPTTLWTNPSTSTSISTKFASQPITLSQSYENFDYIGLHWAKAYSTKSDSAQCTTELYSKSDFSKIVAATSTGVPGGIYGYSYTATEGTRTFTRRFYVASTTSLQFGQAWRTIYSGTSKGVTADNTRCIPLYVYGYKISA